MNSNSESKMKSFKKIIKDINSNIETYDIKGSIMKKCTFNGYDIIFPASAQVSDASTRIIEVILTKYWQSSMTVNVKIMAGEKPVLTQICFCSDPGFIGGIVRLFAEDVAKISKAKLIEVN